MAGDDIRAGKTAKWDLPPWELPGGFRFDAKPHRGPFVRRVANVGFVCSTAALYPIVATFFFCFVESYVLLLAPAVALGLLGVILGLTAWVLAHQDLVEMQTGLTNPEGEGETRFAHDRAFVSFVLGLGCFLLWGAGALLDYLQH
jgi:hypothetical protein